MPPSPEGDHLFGLCGIGPWDSSRPPESRSCSCLPCAYQPEASQIIFRPCLIIPKIHPQFSRDCQPLACPDSQRYPYLWDPNCQQVFDNLKLLLVEAPVLAYPDFFKCFLLEPDASGVDLGVVIAQKQEDDWPIGLCQSFPTEA